MRFWVDNMRCVGGHKFSGMLEAKSPMRLWEQLREISSDHSMWMEEANKECTEFKIKSVAVAGVKGHCRRLYEEDAVIIDMASYREMFKRRKREAQCHAM